MKSSCILAAIEMVGTLRALKKPFDVLEREHGRKIRFAAAGAAATELMNRGVTFFPKDMNPEAIIAETDPGLVIIGAAAGVKPGDANWTGLELGYGRAAMDAGIPVVCYRDYSGLAPWVAELASHPKAKKLFTLLMFDAMTVGIVHDRRLACRKAFSVGSAAYDDMKGIDWAAVRAKGRAALGIEPHEILVVLQPGAKRARVLEVLEPVVAGLIAGGAENDGIVFAPTFHPKDPDAPYAPGEAKGTWVAKPSAYDSIIDRLEAIGTVRVIREPMIRNAIPDSIHRIAVADVILMNPYSTDTWTALIGGTPQIIVALQLTIEEGAQSGIDVTALDFVRNNAVPLVQNAPMLETLAENFGEYFRMNRNYAKAAQREFSMVEATPVIVRELLEAEATSVPAEA